MNTKKPSNQGLSIRPKSLKFSGQIAVIAFGLMLACEEEDRKPQPLAIQFTSHELFLTEGNSTTISMPFGAPAVSDGSVTISLSNNAVYGQHYTTIPAATGNSLNLIILRGQRFIQFQIITMDDNEVNQGRAIGLTLQQPSAGFRIGVQSTLNVTIADNEQPVPEPPAESPVFANIDLQRVSVKESESSGISVRVSLLRFIEDDWGYGSTVPATATGSVTVKFASGHASYGNEFTTVPVATGDSLVIDFTGTQTDTTFTFIPIDNGIFKGSRFISIRNSSATGEIEASGSLVWMEIEDDETGPNQITWTKLENTPLSGSLSSKFHDENNGYIWNQNKLFKTTDGGLHWNELNPDPTKVYGQYIPFFIDDQIGFVGALEYQCDYYSYECFTKTTIFKTTDGGAIWTPVKELDLLAASLYFSSESRGFIGTTEGKILKTVDGGKTWFDADGPVYGVPVSDFIFVSNGTGYAKSYRTVLKTVDSGDTWTASFWAPRETSVITSLVRSSSNILYATWHDCPDLFDDFQAIYRSDDGTTWTPTSECVLTEMLSFSSTGNLGISIGNLNINDWRSVVHLTQNSGSSWILQSMPLESSPISSVVVASDNVIYAFGDGGVILKGDVK